MPALRERIQGKDEIYRQKKMSEVENRRILLGFDLNDPADENAKGREKRPGYAC